MKIFQREIDDGISDVIKLTASIKFAAAPAEVRVKSTATLKEKLLARINDPDLFFHYDILASTGWNKNDDVFAPAELWKARYTPSHKPSNYSHNELDIVGHMVDTYAIDNDGNILTEMTDDFNILVASVVYTAFEDEEKNKTIAKIIDGIKEGTMCVSMECLLPHYDYALVDAKGKQKIIARNEETAFLSKHLRIYGGTGEYQGYRVGRLPRDYVFSGKGYTETPANPKSVTILAEDVLKFTASKIEHVFPTSGVVDNCSDNPNMENEMSAEINVEKLQASVKDLSDTNAKLQEQVVAGEKNVSNLTDTLTKVTAELDSTKTELATVKAAAAKLAEDNKSLKSELQNTARIISLKDGGLEKTEAEELVKKFSFLDDEHFKAVAELAVRKAVKSEAKTVEKAIESATVEKAEAAALNVPVQADNKAAELRTGLQDLASNLIKSNKKK